MCRSAPWVVSWMPKWLRVSLRAAWLTWLPWVARCWQTPTGAPRSLPEGLRYPPLHQLQQGLHRCHPERRQFLSCVLNAENGYENTRSIQPGQRRKRRSPSRRRPLPVLKPPVWLRGHDVTLFEKTTTLGGQLNIACVPPARRRCAAPHWDPIHAVCNAGVHLCMGQTRTAEQLKDAGFEAVINAVGASQRRTPHPRHRQRERGRCMEGSGPVSSRCTARLPSSAAAWWAARPQSIWLPAAARCPLSR